MFQSAEDSGKKIYITVSQKPTADVPEEKKFLVTKDGETAWDRCSLKSDNLTMSGLAEAIKRCLNINDKVESKKLVQVTTEGEININSDDNVPEMFQSAEEKGEKVRIVLKGGNSGLYT